MSKHTIPIKIKEDYIILPLELAPTKSLPDTPATHYLYLRRHQPRVPTPSDARTLFASNLPSDATESQLRTLFSTLGGGRVEHVTFENTPAVLTAPAIDSKKRKRIDPAAIISTWDRTLHTSGSTATILFVDSDSAALTLRSIESLRKARSPPTPLPAPAEPAGLARYAAHHRLRFPSSAHLQSSVDGFMALFDEREEEARRAAGRRRQEPDADGFVTVGRGSSRGKAVRMEEAKRTLEEKEKNKKELKGFYRFQVREDKKVRQQELLARFEEDRKRVEERKRGRRFIPQ